MLDQASDDELAAEEVGGEVVALVDGRSFNRLARHGALIDALLLVEAVPGSAPRVSGAFLAAAGAPRRLSRGVSPPGYLLSR